ncbi:hypothetical protein HDU97_008238 [Phlyctochytrium planicorne]|nr:hypothetical protein HDU97_008238 [Phlyctochytrium planicorne]
MTPREGEEKPHFMEELPPEDAVHMAEAMKNDHRIEDAKTGLETNFSMWFLRTCLDSTSLDDGRTVRHTMQGGMRVGYDDAISALMRMRMPQSPIAEACLGYMSGYDYASEEVVFQTIFAETSTGWAIDDIDRGWKSVTPFRQAIFLYKLFFSRQFFVHRIAGLIFLIEYALSFYLYFFDYPAFKSSFLIWALPATGVFQSINAIYTFTFLPKSKKDGGYFGDKSILSYPFIIENSFYAMILFYQWVYYDNVFLKFISGSIIIEQVYVFFPYVIRQWWPKTSFRDSVDNAKNRTDKNYFFFTVATYVTKTFYIWAKHYIGFFLNYARFMHRVDEEEKYYIHHILVFSSFATTIAVFLQTLKFKRYMGPRTSFIIYFASYMGTFYGFINIYHIFLANPDLTLLTLGGLILNFQKLPIQIGYQVAVCLLLNASRMGVDMGSIAGMPFLYMGQHPPPVASI